MKLHLSVLPGRFAVCRLAPGIALPIPTQFSPLWSLTQTREELSLVCAESEIPPACDAIERGWCALGVAGPLDFALVGVLAALTAPLAAANISLFALSTFNTDYLMVKEDVLAQAVRALHRAGHLVKEEAV